MKSDDYLSIGMPSARRKSRKPKMRNDLLGVARIALYLMLGAGILITAVNALEIVFTASEFWPTVHAVKWQVIYAASILLTFVTADLLLESRQQ